MNGNVANLLLDEGCPFADVKHACDFAGWFYGCTAHSEEDRFKLDWAKRIIAEIGKPAPAVKVFSRPECPFHYCDQPDGGVCRERSRCHHRPNPFEAD